MTPPQDAPSHGHGHDPGTSTSPDAADTARMAEIAALPLGDRLKEYTRLSGPGWLQGAITLGGGSLAGALYLGVIMGYHMLWLQPLAMILGVIMLSAIAYVTLSTGQRPFRAINAHVSPVLGWSWILATLAANVVWCMPQFQLGVAAVQQNLLPDVGKGKGSIIGICAVLFIVAFAVNGFYERGGRGIRTFEIILKSMVAVIVLSFFGVVIALTVKGNLPWGAIFSGFVPDFSMLFRPSPGFDAALAATGDFREFWTDKITGDQRDIMITAFGTAVGINMTFLLPYSMLRKRWGRHHRGLAIFDLSIGLIVPFVLATGCVVIASASQFHARSADVLDPDGTIHPSMVGAFNAVADKRLEAEFGADAVKDMTPDAKEAARAALPTGDRNLAAMLAQRDNINLANALGPLTGRTVAQIVFGVGVLGMALSTIIILMLINGFTVCEMAGKPDSRALHLAGAAIAGIGGCFGPFLWAGASTKAALAIPTSVIGGAMIPIAYFTFLLLMNSDSLLGSARPRGGRAVLWNTLMILSTGIATFGSVWVLKGKVYKDFPIGKVGIGVLAVLFLLGIVGFLMKDRRPDVRRSPA